MKCPRCGSEMIMDGHRKIDLYMCYECGYIEGRKMDGGNSLNGETNFQRLHALNYNETVALMSKGLGIEEHQLRTWLDSRLATA